MLYPVVKSLALGLFKCCYRLRVDGQEHIPRQGPVLLASNHVSVLDPPAIAVSATRPLYFMAKAELFDIPLFGALIRRLNARPVRRGGTDPVALRHALRFLEEGQALLVFPEGTRGVEGALGPGRGGAGMLALMSEAPVVPAYIQGTGAALPRGRMIPRPARVRVMFGAPIQFKRKSRQERTEYLAVSNQIMSAIADLKARLDRQMPSVRAGREEFPPKTLRKF